MKKGEEMRIIPVIHCTDVQKSMAFYTEPYHGAFPLGGRSRWPVKTPFFSHRSCSRLSRLRQLKLTNQEVRGLPGRGCEKEKGTRELGPVQCDNCALFSR